MRDLLADGWCAYCLNTIKIIWCGSKMNMLLLLTPGAMFAHAHEYQVSARARGCEGCEGVRGVRGARVVKS